MPLVRIDLTEGKPPEYGVKIGQVVYRALLDVMNAPQGDCFQVITEHPHGGLQFDRFYLGISRSDDCVFLQTARGRFYQPRRGAQRKLVVRQRRGAVRYGAAGLMGGSPGPIVSTPNGTLSRCGPISLGVQSVQRASVTAVAANLCAPT
jgi:4-oxalocrotonate tautomerase